MMKCIDKKNLPILSFILITACADPNTEIKELNTYQLKNVIDTLYIESNQSEATTEVSNEKIIKSVVSQTLAQNITNDNYIDNQFIAHNPSTDDLEASTGINSSKQETIQLKTESSLLNEDPFSGEDSLTAETSTASINDSIKTTSTGFSKPTTQSETRSEIILEELLSKYPTIDYTNTAVSAEETQVVETYCKAISARLSSVSIEGCLASNHRLSPFKTSNGKPIIVTEFAPKKERKPLGKILVIGGTHGDELTSVSTAYKWISNLNRSHSGLFHWHIAPALNADSVLSRPAIRPNANGVDINRNLPTPDWNKQSKLRWEKLSKNSRKNPGTSTASEPETQWIMHEIATFQPDAIVSIHAPYGILDFDSPKLNNAPANFGRLQLNLLGTYPGSLGHYAGIVRKIPVLTLELPNASTMPSQKELNAIWSDMIKWLRVQLR